METKNTPDTAGRERAIYRVTILGSIVNFVLLIFKFAAGILGHSAAMIADAFPTNRKTPPTTTGMANTRHWPRR